MKKTVLISIALALGSLSAVPGANAAVPEAAAAVRFYPYLRGYPSQRPANAPVAVFERGIGWYTGALAGITKPYPYSLMFLDNQGAWYTPFNRPGMLGYYDIRGLHHLHPVGNEADYGAAKKAAKQNKAEGMVGMSGLIAMSSSEAPVESTPIALPEARGAAGYCAILNNTGVVVYSAQDNIRVNSYRHGPCTLQESGVVVFNP
jgi:hypothetical protein